MVTKDYLIPLLSTKDSRGNTFIFNEHSSVLYLREEKNPHVNKNIGEIRIKHGLIYLYKHEELSQVFRKTDSWSIPLILLDFIDMFVFITVRGTYTISKYKAREFGEIFTFKGMEIKCYIPRRRWELLDAKGSENPIQVKFGTEWTRVLTKPLQSEEFKIGSKFIKDLRTRKTVYPAPADTFKAYNLTPLNDVKVIILGQDPYPDGKSDGLAFSYLDNKFKGKTGALDIIFKEIEEDIKFGLYLEQNFNLSYWAIQGVFLLNTALTVEKYLIGSHLEFPIWRTLIRHTIAQLLNYDSYKVFMLWGKKADFVFNAVSEIVFKKKPELRTKVLVLKAPHPAKDIYSSKVTGVYLDNYPRTFRGCKHFSIANQYLKDHGRTEIRW